MESKKRSGLMRMIFSLVALHSMSIYALMFTTILYLIQFCTGLSIHLDSWFHTFVFVAVITVLLPITFVIDVAISIIGEFLRFIPRTIVDFMSKTLQILALTAIINKVDAAISTVELSMYAEIIFGFVIFIVMNFFMTRGKRPMNVQQIEGQNIEKSQNEE